MVGSSPSMPPPSSAGSDAAFCRARAVARVLAACLAATIAAGGCSAFSPGAGTRPKETKQGSLDAEFVARPLVTEKDRAAGHFLAAIIARFDNDYETAMRETAKAVAA